MLGPKPDAIGQFAGPCHEEVRGLSPGHQSETSAKECPAVILSPLIGLNI